MRCSALASPCLTTATEIPCLLVYVYMKHDEHCVSKFQDHKMVYPNFRLPVNSELSLVDAPRDLLLNLGGKFSGTNLMPVLQDHDHRNAPTLLAKFPSSLTGDLCWDRTTFGNDSKGYVLQFSQDDVLAIRVAINGFKGWSVCITTVA